MARQPTPTQQATQIVRAQYRPIDYALAQSRANSAKQQAALAATGRALIAQLQGGVKPAGQAYDAAVGQQQALAQGGASLLAGLNPNAQIQNTLGAIGAPQAQKDLVANQTRAQFPGQGAVLNIQQGTIPGASLVAQKAAVQNYLAGLPTIAALGQQRSAQGLAAQQAQNAQQLYGQRLQAASQIPQIAQSIGSSEATQQLALQNFLADQSYRQAELGARSDSQKSLDAYRQQSLTQRATAQRQRVKGTGSADLQYVRNPDGSTGIFNRRTGAISPVKGPKGTTAGSAAGLTTTQTRAARAKGNQLLAHIREARLPGATYTAGPNLGNPVVPPTYNQAVRQAEQQGIPLDIVVPMLNTVYPVQYQVTNRGLKQIGIRGQPSTFASGPKRKRK